MRVVRRKARSRAHARQCRPNLNGTASSATRIRLCAYLLTLLILLPVLSTAQDMLPKDCGSCHESQFKTWLDATHNKRGVVCGACHGEFHSGTLNGCTICHTGEHKVNYENWQFVKDYRVEGDTSDYYCIVCHDPHNPIKAKVLLCNTCHGPDKPAPQPRKAFRASIQKAHNAFAEVAPKMDEDVWNRRLKTTSGKIMIGAGVVVVAAILLFPYFYTLFAFFRWVKRKIKR